MIFPEVQWKNHWIWTLSDLQCPVNSQVQSKFFLNMCLLLTRKDIEKQMLYYPYIGKQH